MAFLGLVVLLFERKQSFPIGFHSHRRPAYGIGFVEAPVETADRRHAVVVPFAVGVGVVDVEAEARAVAGGGPLEHLPVAVEVAERGGGFGLWKTKALVGVES